MTDRTCYQFGDFLVDPAKRKLSRNGDLVQLPPKAFDLLTVLIANRDAVISKADLMNAVWPDTFVEEANLTQNVSLLRRALGESPQEHRYIVTYSGRGYRFAAEVTEVSEVEDAVIEEDVRMQIVIHHGDVLEREPIRSIAVLPFLNAGADPSNDYLCDGLTESIINRLTHLSRLKVLARSIVFRHKGREVDPKLIGRELDVGAVLSGRVRSEKRRVIVNLELVESATGWQIWGAQFDRKLAEITDLPEEIAREVSAKLQLELTGDEQRSLGKKETVNTEAYRSYLRGRYFLNKRLTPTLKQAIVHFKQATDHDPEYALAYVGLADVYALLSLYGALRPRDAFPKSKAAAIRALELDPDLAEAHNSLGVVELFYEWNWPRAEAAFRRALELDPDYADAHQRFGMYLTAQQRFEEAHAELTKAQDLDPLSLIISTIAGYPLYYAREYGRAVQQFRQTLEIDPDFSMAHFRLGLTYLAMGRYDDALSELKISETLSNDRDVVAALGRVYARSGDPERAQQAIVDLEERSTETFVPSYDVAVIHAALGNTAEALDWLEKAVEERSYWVIYLTVDPALDPLRQDPRFAELVAKTGVRSA